MNWLQGVWIIVLLWPVQVSAQSEIRFRQLPIYIDSNDQPLAAYQIELVVESNDAQIVGVEGGEHPAFKNPPYYDPKALMGGRIVLAAFSTAKDLPKGRNQMLSVHVRESSEHPVYRLKLIAAADAQGKPIEVKLSFESNEGGN
jgi:hypothetical protein